jgi:uncharacterized protein (DUF488 family)
MNPLYTIGHSNHDLPVFLGLLRGAGVTLVADVRSRPHSQRFPQYSQPEFEQALRPAGFAYLFLGEELGGRPDDADAYRVDGLVDYRRRRKSFGFRQGLDRVLQESKRHTVALLCAEEDPIACHRFLMICPALIEAGVVPQHIRRGGILETQAVAEDRMLAAVGFNDVRSGSLFAADRGATLEDAYKRQAEECAFRADPQAVDRW